MIIWIPEGVGSVEAGLALPFGYAQCLTAFFRHALGW